MAAASIRRLGGSARAARLGGIWDVGVLFCIELRAAMVESKVQCCRLLFDLARILLLVIMFLKYEMLYVPYVKFHQNQP